MQFATINKNHFILMFVRRKANPNKKQRTDLQTYIPHKQALINPLPPPIRNVIDAEYFYQQLVSHGYIPDIRNHPIPQPLPNPNNVLISTVTSSNGSYLEFNPQTGSIAITGADLEEGALDPMPDPNVQYNITLEAFIVADFVTDPEIPQTYHYLVPDNLNIGDEHIGFEGNRTESLTLTAGGYIGMQTIANVRHLVIYSQQRIYYLRFDEDAVWRIDLSPVQTILMLRFTPVNQ